MKSFFTVDYLSPVMAVARLSFNPGEYSVDLWCEDNIEARHWANLFYGDAFVRLGPTQNRPNLYFHHTPRYWWERDYRHHAVHSMIWASDLLLAAGLVERRQLLSDTGYLHCLAHMAADCEDLTGFGFRSTPVFPELVKELFDKLDELLALLPYYFVELHGELP